MAGQDGGALPPAPQRLLAVCRALKSAHTRKKHALVLLEGAKAVRDAAAAGGALTAVVVRGGTPPGGDPRAAALAAARRAAARPAATSPPGALACYAASDEAFDAVADAVHAQGILALMREPRCERAALLDPADSRPLALLDRLQDPGNLGACLRTAAALGFRGALLTRGTTDPFAPKVARAAAATIARLPVLAGGDAAGEVAALAAKGFAVVAAASPGEPPERALAGLAAGAPVALWVGNEGQGIDPDAARAAHRRVWLPLAEGVESLNAAVAFGILAYLLARRGAE